VSATAKKVRVQNRPSADSLAQECLRLIVGGALEAGGRLTESWIVARFEVTHTQAREALHRLEKRGALVLTPRRGATLLSRDLADRDDVRPIWLALLGLALQLIRERNAAVVTAAQQRAAKSRWSKHLAVERAIDAIGKAAGNARLREAMHRLAVEVAVAHSGDSPIIVDQLEEVVEAASASRHAVAARLITKTWAPGLGGSHSRDAATIVLERSPLTSVLEVGKHTPQIRDYLQRVSAHLGAVSNGAPPAATQLANAIRQRIQFGEVRPGDAIREQPLAQAYGVSRGPVRDALRILDRQGLVRLDGRRGATVRRFSVQSALDLSQVRAVVSGVQMAEAARAARTPAWLAGALSEGVELLEKIAAERNAPLSNYIVMRRALAVATLAAGGNVVVGRLATDLEAEVTTLWATVLSKDRQRRSAQTWRSIVDAILNHDAEAAEAHGRRIVEEAFVAALSTAEMKALQED